MLAALFTDGADQDQFRAPDLGANDKVKEPKFKIRKDHAMTKDLQSRSASSRESRGNATKTQAGNTKVWAILGLFFFLVTAGPFLMMTRPDHLPAVAALLILALIPLLAAIAIHVLNRSEEDEQWADIDSDLD